MMKDGDGVCRHIDPLIHRYLVDATTMRSKDVLLRPFAYNFDIFRHVLTHVMFHKMMFSQILTQYSLYPLLRYLIIIRVGSLPTCDPYLPPQIL